MMEIIKEQKKEILFVILIYFCVFQNALEIVWEPFSFIDEMVGLLGGLALMHRIFIKRIDAISKETKAICILLTIFGISGIMGNITYQYQPIKAVVIDGITNFKFFFAILAGYFLFEKCKWDKLKKYALINVKIIVIIFGIVFVVDRIWNVFPSQVRYGISSTTLFYAHPSYLAAAMAFLIVLLMVFYEKENLFFLLIDLVIMAFTLRSKAIAAAVIFVLVYTWTMILNKKLYVKHFIILGCLALIIGAPMIYFYYIQNSTWSPRAVMTLTSFEILKDYFPIGTGFGTYASNMANVNYSPVYLKYGFMDIELMRPESYYLNDTFWPIIIGQTGFIGTVAYVLILGIIIKKCLGIKKETGIYVAGLFIIIYMGIATMAEPAFNNSVSIPLALVLGLIWQHGEMKKE